MAAMVVHRLRPRMRFVKLGKALEIKMGNLSAHHLNQSYAIDLDKEPHFPNLVCVKLPQLQVPSS